MSDFRTRIPCREITSLSKLYNVLTTEYGNMYYKLDTENNEHGELFYVVGVSCHFARDVRELLVTKGVLRKRVRPRGFTAINGPKPRGDSLPEVIDLTGDDSDEETPQAHESPSTAKIPRDLTPGSRQHLPGTEETPGCIAKPVPNKGDSPAQTQHNAVTRIPEHYRRAEQRPIATGNSAVDQGDRPTGRIPIIMLLEGAHS
ncbi:hypothetical protein Forpe1208_v015263 [Fusarium oxysporum f. sp. rapae]|uniref:Uncharacterized protein n=1 Tax=Fusarium oxysporum f. sp. rapae TaxID=485398 RepID=A0A8J5TNC9_FUSOX|nr:hypothetical protein Forpe1208_v015263 [Fusarium oxysporum f. sp. rapae]